jgi:hypothetical protein
LKPPFLQSSSSLHTSITAILACLNACPQDQCSVRSPVTVEFNTRGYQKRMPHTTKYCVCFYWRSSRLSVPSPLDSGSATRYCVAVRRPAMRPFTNSDGGNIRSYLRHRRNLRQRGHLLPRLMRKLAGGGVWLWKVLAEGCLVLVP